MGSKFFKKGGKRIPWILSRGTSFNKGEISRAYTTDTNTTAGDGQNRGETHCWVNVKFLFCYTWFLLTGSKESAYPPF